MRRLELDQLCSPLQLWVPNGRNMWHEARQYDWIWDGKMSALRQDRNQIPAAKRRVGTSDQVETRRRNTRGLHWPIAKAHNGTGERNLPVAKRTRRPKKSTLVKVRCPRLRAQWSLGRGILGLFGGSVSCFKIPSVAKSLFCRLCFGPSTALSSRCHSDCGLIASSFRTDSEVGEIHTMVGGKVLTTADLMYLSHSLPMIRCIPLRYCRNWNVTWRTPNF